MSANPYSAYRTVGTVTADPVALTSMLYDGAVTAIKKARIALEDGRRAAYTKESGRAYEIIGELLATLDMEQGELPKQLSGIYVYCMRLIIESTTGDAAKLNEAERHIAKIGEAWKAATAGMKAQQAAPANLSDAAA